MPNSGSQTSQRLLKYPLAVSKCSVQAGVYAKCVVDNSENLRKDNCLREFNEFKACVNNALKKK